MEEKGMDKLSERVSMISVPAIKRFARTTSKAADEKIKESLGIEKQIAEIDLELSSIKIKKDMSDDEREASQKRKAELKDERKRLIAKKTVADEKAVALERAADEYAFMYSVLTSQTPIVDFRKTERINEKKIYDKESFLELLDRMIKEGKVTDTKSTDKVNEITLNPFISNPRAERKPAEPDGIKAREAEDELEKSKNAILMGDEEKEKEASKSDEKMAQEIKVSEETKKEEAKEAYRESEEKKKSKGKRVWEIAIGVIVLIILLIIFLFTARRCNSSESAPAQAPAIQSTSSSSNSNTQPEKEPASAASEISSPKETPVAIINETPAPIPVEEKAPYWSFERDITSPIDLHVKAETGKAEASYPSFVSEDDIKAALSALDSAYPGKYSNLTYRIKDGKVEFFYPEELTQKEVEDELDFLLLDLTSYLDLMGVEIKWTINKSYGSPVLADVFATEGVAKADFNKNLTTFEIMDIMDYSSYEYGPITSEDLGFFIDYDGFNFEYSDDLTKDETEQMLDRIFSGALPYYENEDAKLESYPGFPVKKSSESPLLLVSAYPRDMLVSYPQEYTKDDIVTVLTALTKAYPNLVEDLRVYLITDGILMGEYPDVTSSALMSDTLDLLLSDLDSYIASLSPVSDEPTKESAKWSFTESFTSPFDISVKAETGKAEISYPSFITAKDLNDAASELVKAYPDRYAGITYRNSGNTLTVNYPDDLSEETVKSELDALVGLLKSYTDSLTAPAEAPKTDEKSTWSFTESFTTPFNITVSAETGKAEITYPSFITLKDLNDAASELVKAYPDRYAGITYRNSGNTLTVNYPDDLSEETVKSELDALVGLLDSYAESVTAPEAQAEEPTTAPVITEEVKKADPYSITRRSDELDFDMILTNGHGEVEFEIGDDPYTVLNMVSTIDEIFSVLPGSITSSIDPTSGRMIIGFDYSGEITKNQAGLNFEILAHRLK